MTQFKYQVENGKPYVVQMPEMEKPVYNDMSFTMLGKQLYDANFEEEKKRYRKHLESRPKYEVSRLVPEWNGREDIDPKEFELQEVGCKRCNSTGSVDMSEPRCKDCKGQGIYTIAIPLPNKSEVDKEQGERFEEMYSKALDHMNATEEIEGTPMNTIPIPKEQGSDAIALQWVSTKNPPKDGTWVLLWNKYSNTIDKDIFFKDKTFSGHTHWMLLPPPPQTL